MKHNTIRHLLLISVLLNVSILGSAAFLHHQRLTSWTSPFGNQIRRDRFLFDELSLKPGQAEAMRKKAVPFRAELDRQRGEIATRRKSLLALLRAENPDMAAIKGVIAEISAMQEEMERKIASHLLAEKALLDKGEQEKFFDLIEAAMTQGRQTGCPAAE